jgi:hypothetical protein
MVIVDEIAEDGTHVVCDGAVCDECMHLSRGIDAGDARRAHRRHTCAV